MKFDYEVTIEKLEAENARLRKVADAGAFCQTAGNAYIRVRNIKPMDHDAVILLNNAWDTASLVAGAVVRVYRKELPQTCESEVKECRGFTT